MSTWRDSTARLAYGLALLALAAADTGAAAQVRTAFHAMGTRVTIEAHGTDTAALEAATQRARQLIERRHRSWYPWRPDSRLARINRRLASGEAAPASDELLALLRHARQLERRSGGRFNPAIGGLIRLWGFDQPPPYESPPPAPSAILAWTALRPSLDDLTLADSTIRSVNPAVRLDLGGIAKGAAVDAAVGTLRRADADAALVNAGGDVAGYGSPDGDPWRIGIRDPAQGVLAALVLADDEAIFSSGDYERYRAGGDGKRHGHVLDPRTGYPAAGAVHATVVAADPVLADAAATALLVAGREDWAATARRMGVEEVLIVDRAGTVRVSAELARRLEERTDRTVQVRRLRPASD